MNTSRLALACGLALALLSPPVSATERFVSLAGGHVPPFLNWSDAATNIQEAIDTAIDGDVVWVTNGVYGTGGKVMAGDLTNRVALDKALTVRSVNGPFTTTIQGIGATNGTLAVRCAWLTNGAALLGFTLQGGATRTSGDMFMLRSGGGAWCASSNALIANCVVKSNAAHALGSGAFQGTLNNCFVSGNLGIPGVAGVHNGSLGSCTVVSNSGGGVSAGAPPQMRLTNCIVYFNAAGNYSGSVIFSYSCTTPLPSGVGNIGSLPQLLPDGFHLASTSPCRGAGTNLVSGTDIDGQPWGNPPAIGCDEWDPAPVIISQPKVHLAGDPVGFRIVAGVAGEEPFACWWMRDGLLLENDGHYTTAHTTNLVAIGVNQSDAGAYQVIVSNAFGVATSAVAEVVMHFVDAAGAAAQPPYSSWATAATNIQDAIEVALPGEIVLVTNGLYATGGKVKGGDLTNRVALDKTILVHSVNGPPVTTIQGARDPSTTIGPLAERCAWLTNGAILSGFTLAGGATRGASGSSNPQMSGGGVWCASTNTMVFNCMIVSNAAYYNGGGAYQATLVSCTLLGNRAIGSGIPGAGLAGAGTGGGAMNCNLRNCALIGNSTHQLDGGGAYLCSLTNCVLKNNSSVGAGGGAGNSRLRNSAITKNWARLTGGGVSGGSLVNSTVTGNLVGDPTWGYGGGAANAILTNCIVFNNLTVMTDIAHSSTSNAYTCTFSYSCTAPLPAGAGNIAADPLLLGDGTHLALDSPCRGAGTNLAVGVDMDGQPWANPPAMGCDEWWPEPVLGNQPVASVSGVPPALSVGKVVVAGQPPYSFSWLKDGLLLADDAHYAGVHEAILGVNDFGLADVGGYFLIISNASGTVTTAVAQVVVHCVNAAGQAPTPPYSDWMTAATNIQDAIDVAGVGAIVLVTNGVYASGGKIMAGDLVNRVALDKTLTVISINGPATTAIEGLWDPATTNGPLAVRCAWLGEGATLAGFTLRNGATRSTDNNLTLQSGGGAWCMSSNAVVVNCWLRDNAAAYSGGGAYEGSINNCVLTNNSAVFGGGASYSTLNNCLVTLNQARSGGGGAYYATLNNCTVVFNYTCFNCLLGSGAGTYNGSARNSIVMFNTTSRFGGTYANYYSFVGNPQYSYCLTYPPAPGTGNINADPQFVDWAHVSVNSPCRGAGSALYATGTDIDGESWANPPSIGCDEVVEANLVGPLSVAIFAQQTNVLVHHYVGFGPEITGRIARYEWSYGDGSGVTTSSVHAWTNAGDYTVTLTAYNTDHPDGVSASLLIHVLPPNQPVLQSATMTTNGFQFEFPGQESVQYWIEMATNLTPPINWQTLQTLYSSPGGVHQITDSTPTNETRFYRVRAK